MGEDPYLYLKLLSTAQDPLPSFVGFLSFFVPLAAIALAFDAVNGEYARGTLSRILSQPIYRDALLFGKFLAGLGTLSVLLLALLLLVLGLGLFTLGVPPGGEEVARIFFFFLATLAYAGVWLALGLLFSVLFRQPATAALAALGSGSSSPSSSPSSPTSWPTPSSSGPTPLTRKASSARPPWPSGSPASPPTPSSPRPSPPS